MSRKECVTVVVRLPDEQAEWINAVAKHAMVKPDTVASVIFAMSVVRIHKTNSETDSTQEVES